MSQENWPAALAGTIAGEVRRYRKLRGMTAQELADRCGEIGMPFPRAVLANFETGRRPTVSVAELLVLAAALEVPPVVLIAPIGRARTAEALPGQELDPWAEALWASGYVRIRHLDGDWELSAIGSDDEDGIVPLYDRHDQLVEELSNQDGFWSEQAATADSPEDMRRTVSWRSALEDSLRSIRSRMRELNLIPPDLPNELAYMGEDSSEG